MRVFNVEKDLRVLSRKRAIRRYLISRYQRMGADFNEAFWTAYPLVEKGGLALAVELVKATLGIF